MIGRVVTPPTVAVLIAGAVGCSGGSGNTTLTMFAATSLTTPLTQLAKDYEHDHPDVHIRLSFGGSDVLVAQVRQGAPADLLATADAATMRTAAAAGLLGGDPKAIGENRLVIIVPKDNPAHVTSLADLGRKDVRVAVCAHDVPCGSLADAVSTAAGVRLHPVTRTPNVGVAKALVDSGELDAALVYRTDAKGDDKALTVALPPYGVTPNVDEVATVGESKHAEAAAAFRDYLVGAHAQSVLAALGFLPPPA